MKVFFNAPAHHIEPLRADAESRVRLVLRRADAAVAHVVVRMVDVNGPRGGRDKRCWLAIKTGKTGSMVVSSTAGDWRTALDDALARAVRTLRRALERLRKPPPVRLLPAAQ